MNKKTKYFIYFAILITLVVIFYGYQQYIVDKNFLIDVNTVCNPKTENCFVSDCSPKTDSECDITPYKKIEVLDIYAPKCLEEHNCSVFSCDNKNESDCSVTYCSSDTLEDGEKCL